MTKYRNEGFKISQRGLDLIKQFEGFSPIPYTCPGGKLTIGFGHVMREGETFETPMTQRQAEKLLKRDLEWVKSVIERTVTVPLSTYQFDALASFIFNIGSGAWETSTLLKKLNEGEDIFVVGSEFLRWIFSGGKRQRGLMRRREAERKIFLSSLQLS